MKDEAEPSLEVNTDDENMLQITDQKTIQMSLPIVMKVGDFTPKIWINT